MVLTADKDSARGGLLLEMTTQAKVGVPSDEHFLIHRAMNGVTGGAAFAHSLMLEDEGPALGGMALAAGLSFCGEGCATPFDGLAFVGIVAIGARDFALEDRMVIGEVELATFIEVTGETDFGGFFWIDDGMSGAARLIMDAAGAMAGFATHLGSVRTFGLEAGMNGGGEILGDIGMTFGAAFGAHESRAGNFRWHHDGAIEGGAGDNHRGGAKAG
jgi:hypothetical protein